MCPISNDLIRIILTVEHIFDHLSGLTGLISLSIIWDFQVFSHIWIFLDSRPSAEYYTMAIYAFQKSVGLSEYGKGAAISLIMIFALIGVTGYYLRQMMRMGDE